MRFRKIIPFSLWPYTWGMVGKTRELAKAEYELSGHSLDKRILEINKNDYEEDVYKRKGWEIDLRYNKIDEDTFYRNCITLIKDPKQADIATLELNKKQGKINDMEYEKASATIRGEPWVSVLSMEFGGTKSLEGSFDLDWNNYFVEKLKEEGYNAPSDDLIVNQWFMEVCRNVALEEFDGTGNFTADSEANLEAYKRWHSESNLPGQRKGYS